MAVDTPARIAILGAGPVGLEAALYARFLGYDVDLYERGRVVEHVQRWGHVRLFTPWHANVSPLGVQALEAQDSTWRPAADDVLLTGRELAERYYLPLAQSDLIVDGLHLGTEVIAVGRERSWKTDDAADPDARIDQSFRILHRDASGVERVAIADVVIDTTGTYGNHNWLGQGGLPAIGEQALQTKIEYGLPDLNGAGRDRYAGRRVLLVGDDFSAATNAVALTALDRPPQLTWVTRHEPAGDAGPVSSIPGDPWPERSRIVEAANRLACKLDVGAFRPGTVVERIEWLEAERSFRVTLAGQHAGTIDVDEIVADVGYQPDRSLFRELHVHECYVTEGPRNLVLAAKGQPSSPGARGSASHINPEPDFYILGAKSYGRDSGFLFSDGLNQVRDLFSVIGDRESLDLYANLRRPSR